MTIRGLDRAVLLAVFTGIGAISAWFQLSLMEEDEPQVEVSDSHDPDYYIENFTATGMDDKGTKYVLEADRLVHFPDDNTALLDRPHVIQYEPGQSPKHAYGDSGWVSSDGTEILLTGNVKIIQGLEDSSAGGVTTTDRLKLKLRPRN